MDISIVIPVYQAESSLSNVIDTLQSSSFLKTKKWELILVDDFSSDSSFDVIQEKAVQFSNIIGISLHKNVGQHSATLAGIKEAKGEFLFTMDDDGEHPVAFLQTLMEALEVNHADVAFAIPKTSEKNLVRKFVSGLFKRSARWFSDGFGDGSAFRLIRKSIYLQLHNHPAPFVFIDEILAWYTKNVVFESCQFLTSNKKSTYHSKRLLSLYNEIMYTYSSFPAQFLTKVGVFGSLLSFCLGVFYIIKKLFFKTKIGFTSITVSILFSASVIMLGLGIIAQYIYRQNKLLNRYPQFSIRERTDGKG